MTFEKLFLSFFLATDCNSSTEAISIDQLLAFPYETVPENDDDGSDFVG